MARDEFEADLLRMYDPSQVFPPYKGPANLKDQTPDDKSIYPGVPCTDKEQTPCTTANETSVSTMKSVRRQLFSPQFQKKSKTIEEVRRKRRRYRDNKKRTFSSWKKRKEEYERSVEAEKIEAAIAAKVQEKDIFLRERYSELKEQEKHKHIEQVENAYLEMEEKSLSSDSDILLLPAQTVAAKLNEIDMKVYMEQLKKERDMAVQNARLFRDIAEKCRTEKREMHNEMCRKMEVIRECYRNKMLEGNTRAGKIVRMAQERKT